MPRQLTPNLWFDDQAEEAAEFYVSVFDDARITDVVRYTEAGPGEPGTVVTVAFELGDQPFVAINGGPQDWSFNAAISFEIPCETQAEVDHYWDRLTDGGQEVQCGWLTDRYGVSWQVVPTVLPELLRDPDPERARRVAEAMLSMVKLDIDELQAAADRTVGA